MSESVMETSEDIVVESPTEETIGEIRVDALKPTHQDTDATSLPKLGLGIRG